MSNTLIKSRSQKYLAQDKRCYYCTCRMWIGKPDSFIEEFGITQAQASRLQCTAEHLKPKSEGGSNTTLNIVAACRFCNENRHHHKVVPSPEKHRATIRKKMARKDWHRRWVYSASLADLFR